MGKYLVGRLIAFSFLGAAVCGAAFIPLFSFSFGEATGGNEGSAILKLIKDIIPSDPVTPFQTGNMLQIIFIAVLAGLVIVLLSRTTEGVRNRILDILLISGQKTFIVKILKNKNASSPRRKLF